MKSLLSKAENGFPALDHGEGLDLFKCLMDKYLNHRRIRSRKVGRLVGLRFYLEALKQERDIQTLLLIDNSMKYPSLAELFIEYGYYVRLESLDNALYLVRNVSFDLIMISDTACVDEATIGEICYQFSPESHIVLLSKNEEASVNYVHFTQEKVLPLINHTH